MSKSSQRKFSSARCKTHRHYSHYFHPRTHFRSFHLSNCHNFHLIVTTIIWNLTFPQNIVWKSSCIHLGWKCSKIKIEIFEKISGDLIFTHIHSHRKAYEELTGENSTQGSNNKWNPELVVAELNAWKFFRKRRASCRVERSFEARHSWMSLENHFANGGFCGCVRVKLPSQLPFLLLWPEGNVSMTPVDI